MNKKYIMMLILLTVNKVLFCGDEVTFLCDSGVPLTQEKNDESKGGISLSEELNQKSYAESKVEKIFSDWKNDVRSCYEKYNEPFGIFDINNSDALTLIKDMQKLQNIMTGFFICHAFYTDKSLEELKKL